MPLSRARSKSVKSYQPDANQFHLEPVHSDDTKTEKPFPRLRSRKQNYQTRLIRTAIHIPPNRIHVKADE